MGWLRPKLEAIGLAEEGHWNSGKLGGVEERGTEFVELECIAL